MRNRNSKNRSVITYYPNQLFRLNSAEELMRYKLFPNVKEWCESYGCFEAVKKIMEWDNRIIREENSTLVVVVGDGHVPRTAALFNYMTKWETMSIDPLMRLEKDYSGIKRLSVYRAKIEEFNWTEETFDGYETVIIIHPHSHAQVATSWDKIKHPRKYLINMPCCVQSNLKLPFFSYVDKFIPTPKNRVEIYSNCYEFILSSLKEQL